VVLVAGEHLEFQTRRVITGVDADGRSTVISDENTPTRVALPGFTVNDVWRVDALPTHVDEMHTLQDEVELHPPTSGFVFRVAAFPPDSEVDYAALSASIESLHGSDANANDEKVMGMHVTDTFDLDVILDGEIYCVLETGEVLLRAGDSIVLRGIKHAWSNRSNKPAVMVATMIPARR
jgi:mannose-6-phosphate isomerase-like protein (cupin superfamily)